jgi:hypothetical protein
MSASLVVYIEKKLSFLSEMINTFKPNYMDLKIVDVFLPDLVEQKDKTRVLISDSETSCMEWENMGGKAIKYSSDKFEKYQGLVFSCEDGAERLKRLLNAF